MTRVNALVAHFPLGVYQGHRADGQSEELPDAARVFSALVSAAWRGTTAEEGKTDLQPSASVAAALAWLEAHPPEALMVPSTLPTGRRPVTSYRREGVFDKGRDRVVAKDIGNTTALAGPLGWIWREGIPAQLISALDALCADVAYLGESDSPVHLELQELSPEEVTHRRVETTAFGAQGTTAVRVPATGRLDALDAAHTQARPAQRPTVAQDRFSMGAEPTSSPSAGSAGTIVARYRSTRASVAPAAPWTRVLLLPVRGRIDPKDTVAWCVALHRALAGRLGDDAPAVVTGTYAQQVRRPANRVAVHLLEPSLVAAHGIDGAAFAVLVPADIDPSDAGALDTALRGLSTVYRGRAGELRLGRLTDLDAATFWPEPPSTAGVVRVWRSLTPFVPETRPQRASDGTAWTLADAALLSVGFVARDRFDVPGRGTARYGAIVDAVRQAGVRVGDIHRVPNSAPGRYAHKVPDSVVVQPFHGTLDFAGLWSPQALVAVGQSRHLGGGLVAPVDVPESLAEQWWRR